MRAMTGLRSVGRLTLASLVLVGVLGQQTDDAAATGSRVAPSVGSAVPRLDGVVLNPASVVGGTVVKGTVTLLEPAPASGAVVTMLSSDPKVAAVPANVMVPAGANSATFVVRTSERPPGQAAVDISARLGNAQPAIARLVVMPPASGGPGPQPPAYDLKKNLKK